MISSQSRDIARESKRDSSAMKAIALLTMFFLPGTFIAVCPPPPSHQLPPCHIVTLTTTNTSLRLSSQCHSLTGKQAPTPRSWNPASGSTGLSLCPPRLLSSCYGGCGLSLITGGWNIVMGRRFIGIILRGWSLDGLLLIVEMLRIRPRWNLEQAKVRYQS